MPIDKALSTEPQPFAYRIGARISRDVTFDAESIRRFAELAGDANPLHHDEVHAAATRFGGLIASGTQYTSLLMAMLSTHIPADRSALGLEFSFKFLKAIRAGETVQLAWEIVSVEPKSRLNGDIVGFSGQILNSRGEVAVTAQAKIVVMPREALFGSP